MNPALLTDAEFMDKLRMAPRTFYRYKAAGHFDRFKVKHPIGRAIWSARLVQLHCDGESTVAYGMGSRKLRRVS